MKSADDFRAKARQCRRLAASNTDETIATALTTLADEFDATAAAIEAEAAPRQLLGDGEPGLFSKGTGARPHTTNGGAVEAD
jgi:hypothetical protein